MRSIYSPHRRPVLLGLVFLLAAGASGAPVVDNPAQPAEGQRDVTLRELWRAGGEDDDVFFGTIGSVRRGPDGNIYLLDSQLSHVEVFGDDGTHLATLGREGEGPGEVTGPAGMFLHDDGRVSLLKSFPGKVVTINADGTPAGELKYQLPDASGAGFNVLNSGENLSGGDILLLGIRMSMGGGPLSDQTYFISRCGPDGVEKTSYLTKDYQINYADFRLDEGKMDFVWNRYAVDADGNVYTAPDRDRYLVRVQAPDGTVIREITRAYTPPARNDADRQRATKIIEAVGKYYPVPLKGTSIEDHDQVITGMFIDDGGQLVVSCTNRDARPDGAFAVLDVFDTQGRFVRQRVIHCAGNADQDGLTFLGGHRAIRIVGSLDAWLNQQGVGATGAAGDEAPVLEVVCYAVP